jgi:peptidoglycan/xylan/chitin deacetylase (PgdA/CDA1 family)
MLGHASPSPAEVATIDVLLDLDRNSETGCGVMTVDGEAAGVELRVRTLFDVGTETVLSTATASCADPLLDLFDIESPILSDPQPSWVGISGNGVAGSMLIESHFPIALTGQTSTARSFVVVSSMVGEDTLFDGDAGALLLLSLLPPVVPGLDLVAIGVLLVASLVVMRNGLEARWLGVVMMGVLFGSSLFVPERGWALLGEGFHRIWTLDERVGSDPEEDAPVGIDLLDFYSAYDPVAQELWLRTDVLFGTPVCLDWGVVDPGSGYACEMQPPPDIGPFGGAVAMTFDDGPHLTVTPLVLDTLRAQEIPATFFVVGNRLQTAAEQALVLEIHNDPLFRVANHSLTHRRMAFLSPEDVEAEVSATNDLIRAAVGDPCYFPRYFRFPYSSSNCESMSVVRTHGLASAAVHINTSDWCYGTNGGSCPAEVVSFIDDEFRDDLPGWAVHEFEASGGGILIMHDIHTNTAAELPEVIAGLQAAGATFFDLSDPVLFPIMNGTMMAPEGPACCEGTVN